MRAATMFTLALALAMPAHAQQAAPAPAAPPAPPAPGPSLSAAWNAAQAALAACKPENVVVAVLDSAGVDKVIASGDGARSRAVDFSRRKAMTALTFGKSSIEVRDLAKGDPSLAQRIATDPKLIGFGGGIPIMRDGQPFGAIAVAGGSSQDLDHRCANAGLAALK